MTAHSSAVARALDDGVVVDFAVERARRRGEGWPALEAELTEVPPLEPVVDVAFSGSASAGAAAERNADVQLSIFGGGE